MMFNDVTFRTYALPAEVTKMAATSEDAKSENSIKDANVLEDTSFLRMVHDGKPATEFPVLRWGGHTLPPPAWHCSILGKSIGRAVEKPSWFNDKGCEAVKNEVQFESTCGLFAANNLARSKRSVLMLRTCVFLNPTYRKAQAEFRQVLHIHFEAMF